MGPLGGNLEPLEVSASLWQFSGSNKDHVLQGERVGFRAQAKKGLLRFTEGHWAKQNIVIPPDPRGSVPGPPRIPESVDAQVPGVVQSALHVRGCGTFRY